MIHLPDTHTHTHTYTLTQSAPSPPTGSDLRNPLHCLCHCTTGGPWDAPSTGQGEGRGGEGRGRGGVGRGGGGRVGDVTRTMEETQ